MTVNILILMSLGTAEWKSPNKSIGHMQSTRWLFQFLNVFIPLKNNQCVGCNLWCVVTSLHDKLKPPFLSPRGEGNKVKRLMKGRCLQGQQLLNSHPKYSPTIEGNHFSQLCLFTLALATLQTSPSPYNNSPMHSEWQRKGNYRTPIQ